MIFLILIALFNFSNLFSYNYEKINFIQKDLSIEDIENEKLIKENASKIISPGEIREFEYDSNGRLIAEKIIVLDSKIIEKNELKKRWEWIIKTRVIRTDYSYQDDNSIKIEKISSENFTSVAPSLHRPRKAKQKLLIQDNFFSKLNYITINEPKHLESTNLKFEYEVELTGDDEYDTALIETWKKNEDIALKKLEIAQKKYDRSFKDYQEIFKKFWQSYYLFSNGTWDSVYSEKNKIENDFSALLQNIFDCFSLDLSSIVRFQVKEYPLPAGSLYLCDIRQGISFINKEITNGIKNGTISKAQFKKHYLKIIEKEKSILQSTFCLEKKYQAFLINLESKYPLDFAIAFGITKTYFAEKKKIYDEQLENFWSDILEIDIDNSVAIYDKGKNLKNKGEYEKAIIELNNAERLFEEEYDISQLFVKQQLAGINFERGFCYSECNAFDKAIAEFSFTIENNPFATDAYLERAAAYFEIGNIEASLKDFDTFISADEVALYLPLQDRLDFLDFGNGLINGINLGMSKATREFIPSLIQSPMAVSQFFWAAITESPYWMNEISIKSYDFFNYILESDYETLTEDVLYPLYDMTQKWISIPHYEKGQAVGSIIGEFGINIMGPCAAFKGVQAVKKFHDLKKINKVSVLQETKKLNGSQNLDSIKSYYSDYFFIQAQELDDVGKIIAGTGTKKDIKDIRRLIKLYGGVKEDWVKKVSETYFLKDLDNNLLPPLLVKNKLMRPSISCHWYENVKTKKKYEFKTKLYSEME